MHTEKRFGACLIPDFGALRSTNICGPRALRDNMKYISVKEITKGKVK